MSLTIPTSKLTRPALLNGEQRTGAQIRFFRLFITFFMLGIAGNAAAEQDEMICRSSPTKITVLYDDKSLAGAACRAVAEAVPLLEGCGLTQSAPVRIEVGNGPLEDYRNCLGVYHCESDEIYVLGPEAMSKLLPEGSPLAAIPAETLFSSIVTHELGHAFLYQMRGSSGQTIAEDEYVAYAMQYLSLSEVDRNSLLEAMPGSGSYVSGDMLNELFLTMSPVVFGSWAWRHFESQEDGCSVIAGIVAGEVDFTIDAASQCPDPPECTIN